jgi:carbonic anhydrase
MEKSFKKIIKGYRAFRKKYANIGNSVMRHLAHYGQKPKIMVVACCDSRVDPALILQCDPGDLFIVRNVANIVPPYEADEGHHGTSAALEFGICYLDVKDLIILGHSHCGGIDALLNSKQLKQNDFITRWVSLIKTDTDIKDANEYAKQALIHSYENCLTFPWIKERMMQKKLHLHLWFFDIREGEISAYSFLSNRYQKLTNGTIRGDDRNANPLS